MASVAKGGTRELGRVAWMIDIRQLRVRGTTVDGHACRLIAAEEPHAHRLEASSLHASGPCIRQQIQTRACPSPVSRATTELVP